MIDRFQYIKPTYLKDYCMYDADLTGRVMSWGQEKTAKATLEAHRERVRQVYARSFGAAKTSSEWVQGLLYVEGAKNLDDLKKVCDSFDIVWRDAGDMITKNEQIQALKEELRKTQVKLDKLQYGRWGKEPANGTVFKIERRYERLGVGYTFAAVKASGLWYITGTKSESTRCYTWEELQAWAGKYSRVWKMTVAEELVD